MWAVACAAAAAGGAACGGGHGDDAAAQGAALRRLFFERERAGRLVVWDDPREPGPVFDALGAGRGRPAGAAALARSVGAPVTVVGGAELRRLFRDHADGWEAFYRAYPGTAGLVEVAAVRRDGPGRASVVVGRACGEQCLNAWRVELRRDAGGGGWRAGPVAVLRVPR